MPIWKCHYGWKFGHILYWMERSSDGDGGNNLFGNVAEGEGLR